jgi:hypothetical protein
MKKLVLKTYREEMQLLKASKAQQEIIMNNIQQYNSLVDDYQKGDKVNQYLLYQLNLAINRQMADIKKVSDRAKEQRARARERLTALKIKTEAKAKVNGDDEDDTFTQVVNAINKTKGNDKKSNS